MFRRMRPDPGFGVVVLPHEPEARAEAEICALPNEHVVFFRYLLSVLLLVLAAAVQSTVNWWSGAEQDLKKSLKKS